MQRYSVQFRNTILRKMIGPEKRKAADLSEKFGFSAATIYGWKLSIPTRYGVPTLSNIRMDHRFVYLTAVIDYYSCTLLS